MKIALAQINTKVGDLQGNTDRIIRNINNARDKGAELVIFPELSIAGYPPRDLLDFDCFADDNLIYLDKIRQHTENISVICGFIDKNPSLSGKKLFNTAALIKNGEIQTKYTCVSCSSEIMTNKRPKFCPKCGKNMMSDDELRRDLKMRRIIAPDAQLHHCGICRQDIKFGLTFCPNCKESFHYHHLSNWVLSHSSCPLCKTKLELGK